MRDQQIDPGTGLTGFRRYTLWTLAGTTVLVLADVAGGWALDPDPPPAARLTAAGALAVLAVAVPVLLARRLPPAGARTAGATDAAHASGACAPAGWLAASASAAAVVGAVMLADRQYVSWAYAPATALAVAAAYLPAPRRWRLVAGAAATGSALGGAVAAASGDGLVDAVAYPAGLTAGLALVTLGMLWSWDVADRLDEARRLAAEVAVQDERLRFAAELHDVQGHHLQVIALKSELAARLAERDPARAAGEMEEVRRLATDAIGETRAVVQGYRRTTLGAEIANATRVLAAAGIDATTPADPDGADGTDGRAADPDLALLGLVVREATTNVLRHSRARHASLDFRVDGGCARLRIDNDGVPAADPESPAPAGAAEPGGTGLRSLAERLAAAGGQLTWARAGDRFEVAASLPVAR